MREVADELDRKSVGGLSYQYDILEEMGYLRRGSGRPRAVEVRLPSEPDFPAGALLAADETSPTMGGLTWFGCRCWAGFRQASRLPPSRHCQVSSRYLGRWSAGGLCSCSG